MLFCVDKELITDKEKSKMLEYWAASMGKEFISEKEIEEMIK